MFLFNKYRNAQQVNTCGNKVLGINWKTFLNTSPLYGAESSAVFDDEGNLYFGSHSGNFYSLNASGSINWVFSTKQKIYSSPLLVEDKIYFTGGDGYMYCVDTNGKLVWKYDLSATLNKNYNAKVKDFVFHLPFTFDFQRKKNITFRSWASPNYTNGYIYTTGYGKGLYCFDLDGELIWSYDLGFPRYQLSGVALDEADRIYCCSRNGVAFSFHQNGDLLWKKKLKRIWEPWGNPVVSKVNQLVFFFLAQKEKRGIITALDFEGNIVWSKNTGAIRGSCALSHDESTMYYCDLDGYLYQIDISNGDVIAKVKVTNTKRGLWTTPTIDGDGSVLISTKDNNYSGRIIKYSGKLEKIWEFPTHKTLSVPVINKNGDVFFGAWDGCYYSLRTK